MLKWVAAVALGFASGPAFAAEALTGICVGAPQERAVGESEDESCTWLLRARRELAAARAPEAAAFALRAERAAGSGSEPSAVREAARFLRGEALARAGHTDQALALFESLSREEAGRLTTAAGLRQAALLLDAGRAGEASALYARLLPGATLDDASAMATWLRAAQAALAAGEPATARRWLEQARTRTGSTDDAALLQLYLGELLAQEGARQAALATLRALSAEQGGSLVGSLAAARVELLQDRPEEALALLETPLVGGSPSLLEPSLRALLARALESLVARAGSDDGCRRIIGRVGSRLSELAWRARSGAALETVAACSDRLGLERFAARLRAARVRDFAGEAAQSPSRDAGEPDSLADGPARAARAYASGDFAGAKAMRGAGDWAALSDAGETVRRARTALAEPERFLQ